MDSPSFLDLVNVLMGTRSVREFSRGNTLPLVQRPWAMTAWSLVTGGDPWFFHPDLPKLRGLRATRQSSPWKGDYGGFTLCPQTGPLVTDPERRASAYRLDRSLVTPQRLKTEFLRYRVAVDLAPSERGALLRLTYAEGGASRILVEVPQGSVAFDEASGTLRGQSTSAVGAVPRGFAGTFLMAFDRPVARWGVEGTLIWVEFDLARGAVVEARIATSFLGLDQARVTLDREIGTRTVEELAEEGAVEWNRLLSRLEIEGGSEDQRRTFYSCLYRALCFPRKIHEYDSEGLPVHLNLADGSRAAGTLCADNGFWDTHRTVYPLYALAFRDELPEILEGWIQVARDTGWLASSSSPGHRTRRSGTPVDAVFAEAVSKGVEGFDLETAWTALKRHAFETVSERSIGRTDLADYQALGYLPDGKGEHSVSATLDFAYGDWCLSRIARHLGHESEAQILSARSQRWQHLFDASMGFFRPRDADGSWTEGFDPLAWGGAFAEGSAWQGGWAVPHDPEGLISALGGAEVALARLDTLLALKPLFQVGAYNQEIHEMTEMALADFGQYAHSVQSTHGILWFYALAGRPEKTERLTRRVLDELYGAEVGFCGDEDAGEMGAWFIWAALGLFPFCPGSPDYVLGSPLFPRVAIHSGDNRTLVVEAPGNGPDTPVVLKRTLGHVVLLEPRVSHADLFDLGHLVCEMGK